MKETWLGRILHRISKTSEVFLHIIYMFLFIITVTDHHTDTCTYLLHHYIAWSIMAMAHFNHCIIVKSQ